MHLTIVAGARPNFVKIAPIIKAIKSAQSSRPVDFSLVHTGQHYSHNMSASFFEDLNIPAPTINLGVGPGSQAEQTAKIMVEFEKYLLSHPSDCVLVVGDVNSTMACAIVAKKLGVKVVHVEGGLRSRDLTMPEEINRMVTDAITDYFFTTSIEAGEILKSEGVLDDNIFFVGNTMIDSLIGSLDKLKRPSFDLPEEYFLLTLHRPSNVDEEKSLHKLLSRLDGLMVNEKIVFPIHPRTESNLSDLSAFENIIFTPPLPYLEFLYLVKGAMGVITDSGGIQEETTYLKVPCMTLRNNTERPETISIGSNVLIAQDMSLLETSLEQIRNGKWKESDIPPKWDGKAGERIIALLAELL